MSRISVAIISLLLAAVLYLGFIVSLNGQRILNAMRELDWVGWAGILSLSLFNYGLRFSRWNGYFHRLGHSLSAGRHMLIYVAGFTLTTTPGKTGESLRAFYLARFDIPYTHTLAAIFTERLLDLMAILALSTLAAISFTDYASWLLIPLGVILAILWCIHRRGLLLHAKNLTRNPNSLAGRAVRAFVESWERAYLLLSWKSLLEGFALGCIAWAAEGLAVYMIVNALGFPISLALAVGIYAIGLLIGALSFLPGGLGSTEATMVFLLTLAGVASTSALSITIIARVATLWFAVALGMVCLAILELQRRQHKHGKQHDPFT